MKGKRTTEYTFNVNVPVTVYVDGMDTEDNYNKALLEAVKQIRDDVNEDWLEYVDVDEYVDYEDAREAS